MYRIKLAKSNSLGLQFGLGLSNFNLANKVAKWNSKSDSSVPIAAFTSKDDYRRNKLALTYLDVPIELSLKSKKGLKFTLGFSAGVLINAHTKTVAVKAPFDTDKHRYRDVFNDFRYGPEIRLGYKKLSLYARYDLNSSLANASDTDFRLMAVGIMFSKF
jgi:hypothetical protein